MEQPVPLLTTIRGNVCRQAAICQRDAATLVWLPRVAATRHICSQCPRACNGRLASRTCYPATDAEHNAQLLPRP